MKEDLWEFLEDQQSKGNEGSFVNTKAGFPVPNLELGFDGVLGLQMEVLAGTKGMGKVLKG